MLRRTTHGPVRCAWPGGCVNEAVDPDEILSRARGGSISDPANVWLLCRTHHDWKHAHPAQAKAVGLYPSADPLPRRVRHAYDQRVPTPDTHSPKVALRLSATGIAYADQLAGETGQSRSAVLRAMFSVATAHRDETIAYLASKEPTP